MPQWRPSLALIAVAVAYRSMIRISGPVGLRLHRWNDRAVVAVAIAAFASGFAQFGVVAALGDVARGFG